MFEEDHSQYYQPVSSLGEMERAAFIRKTYIHLAGAVALFIGLELLYFGTGILDGLVTWALFSGSSWRFFGLVMGILFIVSFLGTWAQKSHNVMQSYAGLGLAVLLYSIMFLPLLYFVIIYLGTPQIITQAGIITCGLFLGLTAIVFMTRKDFSFMGGIIALASTILLFTMIAGLIFGFQLGVWFTALFVLISAGAILFQTSNLIHNYSTDQHVAASLGLFASVMSLFWNLIILLMRLSRD